MIDLEKLKSLISGTIERIFLIVFPPDGEELKSEIDIRFGIVLKEYPGELITISTDLSDIWSPVLKVEPIPDNVYNELMFDKRMRQWMNDELKDEIALEYYEVTYSDHFRNIAGNPIKEIQVVSIEGNQEPFGLKILFESDYILSFPNSDGNTIETKYFNKLDLINRFKHLGNIIYTNV